MDGLLSLCQSVCWLVFLFFMKNLLYFIPSLNDGGAERLVVDYCSLIDKTLFNPMILTVFASKSTANYKRATSGKIKTKSIFGSISLFKRIINRLLSFFLIPLYLRAIIRKNNISILHINMALLSYAASISTFLKKRNIKLFYTCHGDPAFYFSGKNKKELKACKKLLRNNSIQLIALHKEMCHTLNHIFGINNVIVVRNGIVFSEFNKQINKNDKRQMFGISPSSYVIGHIGRFDFVKNHSFLIDIFKRVVEKKPNSHLLLIGDGQLKEECYKKIETLGLANKVTILSHRIDIPDLLSIMDVFVFPSIREGLSVTLIEAQVSGLSCVVSDAINHESFCSNKVTALSLNKTSEEWADAVVNPVSNIHPTVQISFFDLSLEMHKIEKMYL